MHGGVPKSAKRDRIEIPNRTSRTPDSGWIIARRLSSSDSRYRFEVINEKIIVDKIPPQIMPNKLQQEAFIGPPKHDENPIFRPHEISGCSIATIYASDIPLGAK